MTPQLLLKTALEYRTAGLDVIPDHPTEKYPVGFADWQTKVFSDAELSDCILNKGYGIGIRNQEGLDFDNHAGEAKEAVTNWRTLVDKLFPGLVKRLLIEKSVHGGYHIAWKCDVIEGNQKLASRFPTAEELKAEPKVKAVTFIETRGQGGQFVVSPTLGYEVINGDWQKLPTITPEERSTMLDCARSLNQLSAATVDFKPQSGVASGDRPGDLYNAKGTEEALELLIKEGWTKLFNRGEAIYLRRPGKDTGISASFGHIAPGVFYCFSSNGAPFEQEKAYTPFAVFTILKHNGDFTASAIELAKRYGSSSVQDLAQKAIALPIETDLLKRFEETETRSNFRVYSGFPTLDKSTSGFRSGALQVVAGLKKSGKSSFLMAMTDDMLKHGASVGFIDTELNFEKFVERFTAISTNRPIKEVENNREYSKAWLGTVKDKFFYADKKSVQNPSGFSKELILLQLAEWVKKGVKVVCFDNLTTIATESTNLQAGWKKMGDILDEMIDFAKDNHIVIFTVLHTKPQVIFTETPAGIRSLMEADKLEDIFKKSLTTNRRPSTADLYGGGMALSQISGGIMFVWRPYQDAKDHKDMALLILEDFRDGALFSEVEMTFQMEKLKFVEKELPTVIHETPECESSMYVEEPEVEERFLP